MTQRNPIPSTPGEAVAALTLNDGDEATPYLSIFYTVREGAIYFFGMEVAGTEYVHAEQADGGPTERLLYRSADGAQSTNPNEGEVLVSGVLDWSGMEIEQERIRLDSQEQAVNFIQVIRYVYTMQAQLLQEAV